ncbi:MAG TPA: hypothetical protein VMR54_14980 [Thermoanaerobaculia bacterium]|nr:hypothetical protein [Thermoanaerobaculia bacterium]
MRITRTILAILGGAAVACAGLAAVSADGPGGTPTPAPGCAMHSTQDEGVDSRGDQVMGFAHEKTSHHFRLTPSGGSIEADAKDPDDTESRDQIRAHLRHIAKMFSEGDFEAPMLIHDQVPPGVPVLKQLRSQIRYQFESTPQGGRVVISTKNPQALAAIHDFLRFQIREHRTGDSTEVTHASPR